MSAERLREAAALMRERAEDASAGPWKRYGMAGVAGAEWEIVDERRVECECGEPVALTGCATNADALHIASWHPAVALAVADWLDSVGGTLALSESGHYWNTNTARLATVHRATAVADAYLGGPS